MRGRDAAVQRETTLQRVERTRPNVAIDDAECGEGGGGEAGFDGDMAVPGLRSVVGRGRRAARTCVSLHFYWRESVKRWRNADCPFTCRRG